MPLWISHPGEIGLVLQHLPKVRIGIEAMQRELQLRRQRETVKRSSRSIGYNPITCCAATRWVSTAYGMKRPMRKKKREELSDPLHVESHGSVSATLLS